ncbi:MAG: type II toxin-antitoxin system RelE/ParE family toxin [Spirochaetaceae bacterium]|jgi:addiction module RelE/StbE family toxin|nr:type II toxin-antitoxin system RelE/ParE family toxin [Spirochaetaceae bacterium]
MLEVRYLPSFYRDLRGVVKYISLNLKAPQAAENLVDEIERAVNALREFPLAHRLYQPAEPLSKEYRVATVKNYLLFYTVDDIIRIHRVIYKGRNLANLIT